MKIHVHKTLKTARFYLTITATSFTQEEKEKMSTFGSPFVSIAPKKMLYHNQWVDQLPLYDFTVTCDFASQAEADQYLIEIKERLKNSVSSLRSMQDTYSDKEEHEF